jgi:polygalacturonase
MPEPSDIPGSSLSELTELPHCYTQPQTVQVAMIQVDGGSRRKFLSAAAGLATLAPFRTRSAPTTKVFDARDYGAAGDGTTIDTQAIQRTIDAAAAVGPGSQVLIRGGKKYLVSTLVLKSGIDFHLADNAELVVSTNPAHYPSASGGVLTANGAQGLKISGTGNIHGRATEFMKSFSKEGEIWMPGPFRPKIFILAGCRDLIIQDITFSQAPYWGLHMIGCEHVLVDRLKIRNNLDVPNCDGIDPDHCRDVEIRNCDIVCGDDGIVIKTTREGHEYGSSSNVSVKNCMVETKDSGLKIGTETVDDIHDVRFEDCEIRSSCRGLTIQLRDEGNVSNVTFRNIRFTAQYQAAPWWGRGEAISLTAIPRSRGAMIGKIENVRMENVSGRAENSVRVNGVPESRINNVTLDHVAVTLERWSSYPGAVFDNRPTTAVADIEQHGTPGISIRHADQVVVKDCQIAWGSRLPDSFTHALEVENSTNVALTRFTGEAAHPGRDQAIVFR